MSGLYGHISHLYEDPSLKLSDIKEIFNKAIAGQLLGTEKIDGKNIFISYSSRDNRARAARNKTNIKQGGLTAEELAQKFENRGLLLKAFKEAFAAFESIVSSLREEEKLEIFGPNANIYYNAEIQDPNSPNVVRYDIKALVIHRNGHAEYDKHSGNIIEEKDITGNFKVFEKAIERIGNNQLSEYKVIINPYRNIDIDNTKQETLRTILEELDNEIALNGISDNASVAHYMSVRLSILLDQHFHIPEEAKTLLIKMILGTKGINTNNVLSLIPKDQSSSSSKIVNLVKNSKSLLKSSLFPLENIIHKFSVELLNNVDSKFIRDNKKEILRLRKELADAVYSINNSNNPEAINVLQTQMKKIKDLTTAIEGLVFSHNSKIYKLTGNFAPVNQILGLFKYGRGNIPALQKLKEIEKTDSFDIGLYPGKFKPPHKGHYLAAKKALKVADKIYVLISPETYGGITADQSKDIWDLYISNTNLQEQIIPIITKKSPVAAVYNYIDKYAQPESSLALILGEKDILSDRFDRASDRRSDILVKVLPIEIQGNGIEATDMRNFIFNNDIESFKSYLPTKLPDDIKDDIWSVVKGDNDLQEFTLDDFPIDLEEISGMAAGSIEGSTNRRLTRPDEEESIIREYKNNIELFMNEVNTMNISREEFLEEQKIRKFVRRAITLSEKKLIFKQKNEENKLRSIIRGLIKEVAEEAPYDSTGLNKLDQLFKSGILKTIRNDFKKLVTDKNQRDSFRAHIIKAIQSSLIPIHNMETGEQEEINPELALQEIAGGINLDVDKNKFMKAPDGSEEEIKQKSPEEEFGIEGEDVTGRDTAMETFNKVDSQIEDAYKVLSNDQDQELFYDYLITNLKLYFDKWEGELQPMVQEPTSDTYDQEKDQMDTQPELDSEPELDL